MDKEIREYRQKHPKCKWCKYYQIKEEEEKNEIKITRSE